MKNKASHQGILLVNKGMPVAMNIEVILRPKTINRVREPIIGIDIVADGDSFSLFHDDGNLE